jgi:ABC-type transport system substrate-binding protein
MALAGILKSSDITHGISHINNKPVSAGVYYIYSKNDEKITLKKNKYHHYYDKNKKAPDRVELILQNNPDKLYASLLQNEIDFIEYVPLFLYNSALQNNKFTFIEKESNNINNLYFNTKNELINSITDRHSKKTITNPLKNKNVRKAIAHAIDMNHFIKNEAHEKANSLAIPILKNVLGYPIDKDFYRFDLELSLKLMKDEGYQNGFKMPLYTYDGKFSRPLAKYIKKSLEKINIEVDIIFLPLAELSEYNHDRPLVLRTQSTVGTSTLIQLLGGKFLIENNHEMQLNSYRYYSKNIADAMIELMNSDEFGEPLQNLYKNLTDAIYNEYLILPLMNPHDLHLLNNKFTYKQDNFLYFHNFNKRK